MIAGNADRDVVKANGTQYAWLKREEIQDLLTREGASKEDTTYFGQIAHLLNE